VTDWKVLDHGEPEALSDNLWSVTGTVPKMPLRRRMIVARSRDGGLILHSAIAMDEAGMAWLEGLGALQVLVVPNGWHRLDAPRYKARYPQLRVLCPAGSEKRVARVVAVDATYDDGQPFAGDDSIALIHLDGVGRSEGVMRVRSADGHTLVFNDAVFNLAHLPGFFGLIYGRLMGSTGGARVTPLFRFWAMRQKKHFRAHLERLAQTPDLRRIFVAHGDPISADPGAVLGQVAARL
jgi:hypothetical protein